MARLGYTFNKKLLRFYYDMSLFFLFFIIFCSNFKSLVKKFRHLVKKDSSMTLVDVDRERAATD